MILRPRQIHGYEDGMKGVIILLALGFLLQLPAMSQGVVQFDINFGANPPPHTSGDPFSGATLTNNTFYAAVYLDATEPVSGLIEELDGGIFTPIFQFTNLVFATYPGGGPAYDYEDSWQLTDTQVQNLLAGQWYAKVDYSDVSYTGQIQAVPEPSSLAFLLAGLAMIYVCVQRCAKKRALTGQIML